MILKAGAQIHQQQTEHHIVAQGLGGHLRVNMPGETIDLHADQVLSLESGQRFGIEAVEESELLLWVGWSKE